MIDTQGVKLTFNKASLSAFQQQRAQDHLPLRGYLQPDATTPNASFGYSATARDESRSQHARDAAMGGIVSPSLRYDGIQNWNAQSAHKLLQFA